MGKHLTSARLKDLLSRYREEDDYAMSIRQQLDNRHRMVKEQDLDKEEDWETWEFYERGY